MGSFIARVHSRAVVPHTWFKPYTDDEYQRREVLAFALMISGMIWFVVLKMTGWNAGTITAFASVFIGAAFGCYMERKTERGVWLLAMLFGGLTAAFYLFTIVMEIHDHINRRLAPPWWIALDFTVAGMIVSIVIRASWTVYCQNRNLS